VWRTADLFCSGGQIGGQFRGVPETGSLIGRRSAVRFHGTPQVGPGFLTLVSGPAGPFGGRAGGMIASQVAQFLRCGRDPGTFECAPTLGLQRKKEHKSEVPEASAVEDQAKTSQPCGDKATTTDSDCPAGIRRHDTERADYRSHVQFSA
jgi:hypothetical protein